MRYDSHRTGAAISGPDRHDYAWALVSMVAKDRDLDVFKLEVSADLADLQRNMTALLNSQLDK